MTFLFRGRGERGEGIGQIQWGRARTGKQKTSHFLERKKSSVKRIEGENLCTIWLKKEHRIDYLTYEFLVLGEGGQSRRL